MTTIEDEIAGLEGDDQFNDDGQPNYKRIRELNKIINQLEDDKQWMETTLEALEWVLGETDVKAEQVSEEEQCHLITSSTK